MASNFKVKVRNRDSNIFMNKSKILEKVSTHQVVIIVGQTGCGKSTQIPQYLYQSGLSKNGMIACLHPRCIAAMSLADRVSNEMGAELGSLVGYSVRFYSKYDSVHTKILYMTTGYMLRILENESVIDDFSVVIIDEAHERSWQNDLMMGRMKMIMKKNSFIKLVIMSATLNVKEIESFYPGSVTVQIQKYDDHVNVVYRPSKGMTYLEAVKNTVKEILKTTKLGHILVFLPSEEKVRKCQKLLWESKTSIVLPFYSAMDYDDKMRIFEEFGWKRKVILATNIAETSLTIDGVDFVVDSGYVKRVKYDHENRVEKWVTERISVAEADQRKGRTGRTGPGKCYRLYDEILNKTTKKNSTNQIHPNNNQSERENSLLTNKQITTATHSNENFGSFSCPRLDYPVPEINYINLDAITLMLKSLGFEDILTFPFIVKPDCKRTELSIAHLKELSLLNNDGTITNLGTEVNRLPLDPTLGKVAVVSSQLSCRREVVVIIALSSVMNIFMSPSSPDAQIHHQLFSSVHGDLFQLLNVYEKAAKVNFNKRWCKDNHINYSGLKYARMIEDQLHWLLPVPHKLCADLSRSKENQIKKAFLAGFFNNIAYPIDEAFQTFNGKPVTVHQHSCLNACKEITMGTTLLQSANKNGFVLRSCTTLNREMLEAYTPQKYKVKANLWRDVLKKLNDTEKKSDPSQDS